MNQLKLSEEYQKLLPPLPHSEYEALKTSIKKNGLYSAITVNKEGVILDGYHRHKACMELGVEPRYEVKDFEDPLLEKVFVIESNLYRRHLNDFQKVELSLPLLQIETELAKQRQLDGKTLASNDAKGKAAEFVANKIGVSTRMFERAKTIIEKGSERLKESARKGKISVNAAYIQVHRAEKHAETPQWPSGKGSKEKVAWILPDLTKPWERIEVEADYVPEERTFPDEVDGEYFAFVFFGNSEVYKRIKQSIDAIASRELIGQSEPTKIPIILFAESMLKHFGDKRLNKIAGKKDRPATGYFREGWTYWGAEIPFCKPYKPNSAGRQERRDTHSRLS